MQIFYDISNLVSDFALKTEGYLEIRFMVNEIDFYLSLTNDYYSFKLSGVWCFVVEPKLDK